MMRALGCAAHIQVPSEYYDGPVQLQFKILFGNQAFSEFESATSIELQ
jgi:hypothetical protein